MGEHPRSELDGPARRHLVAWCGRFGGPVLALIVYMTLHAQPDDVLSESGAICGAIGVLMAVYWMTEAMPLPATALLPIPLFPVFGVTTVGEATAPYADPIIFLFMGGFMLALAMERWNLHKRIALKIVSVVGTEPRMLVGGFMLAAALLSMWVSNTATTVMMLPIAVSIITLVLSKATIVDVPEGGSPVGTNFAVCMMLGVAYGANIGGVGTLIGTPPNTILAGFLEQQYEIRVSFMRWMMLGIPFVAVFLIIAWVMLTRFLYPVTLKRIEGSDSLIDEEVEKLGRVSRGEWTVFIIFIATAVCWIARGFVPGAEDLPVGLKWLTNVNDAMIAMAAGIALFAAPVNIKENEFALDWPSMQRLPWGILLLFGGGLSLARAVSTSGVDHWIGLQAEALGGVPLIVLVLVVTALIVFLTEVTSNTATATTFMPVLAGVAAGLDANPLFLLVPAAMGASCAFMMPVATPPNAIVFGSGYVTIRQMMKAGLWLNFVGIAIIVGLAYTILSLAIKGQAG